MIPINYTIALGTRLFGFTRCNTYDIFSRFCRANLNLSTEYITTHKLQSHNSSVRVPSISNLEEFNSNSLDNKHLEMDDEKVKQT